MAALVRTHDWSATPLGPIEQWPQSLRTIVLLVLTGGFPMIVLWGRGLVQVYNDRYRDLMGDKHPAGLGQPTRECWPEVWHINQPIYERVFAGETVTLEEAHFPLQRQTEGGRVDDLYLTLAYSPVFDEQGAVGGVLVTLHDVTAQVAERRAEAERARLATVLQAERMALLEEVFRAAPSFLHVLRGPQFVFEFANEAYYRLVGQRDLLGRPAFEAMPEAASGGYQARIARVMATREPFYGHELPVTLARTPGGAPEERIIDLVYLPIIDPDGSCTRVLGHGTDVTERVREQERLVESLRQADARKDQFLAMLAHELRNPMAPLRNAVSILERDALPAEQRRAALQMMRRQCMQMGRLIDDLLEVSRIKQDKIQLRRESIAVGSAIYSAVEAVQPLIDAKHQRLEVSLHTSSSIDADPLRLAQIVTNLLTNASKFTPEAGLVELSAEEEDNAVVIRVCDTGAGISAEMLPQVFDLFSQADCSLDRSQGGLGIGLSLVKRLVEMHGGSVQAASAGLGKGACFTVRLPRRGPSTGTS